MGLKEDIKERLEEVRPTRVFSYIHNEGRLGVLLEIESDTDFALRNELVADFAHEVCLQITAMNPTSITQHSAHRSAMECLVEQSIDTKLPPAVQSRILNGKMAKWDQEHVLLEMPWVKDNDVSIRDLLIDLRVKLDEKVVIKKFARFGS